MPCFLSHQMNRQWLLRKCAEQAVAQQDWMLFPVVSMRWHESVQDVAGCRCIQLRWAIHVLVVSSSSNLELVMGVIGSFNPQTPARHRLEKKYFQDSIGYDLKQMYGWVKSSTRGLSVQDFAILPTMVWNHLCEAGEAGRIFACDSNGIQDPGVKPHYHHWTSWHFMGTTCFCTYAALRTVVRKYLRQNFMICMDLYGFTWYTSRFRVGIWNPWPAPGWIHPAAIQWRCLKNRGFTVSHATVWR